MGHRTLKNLTGAVNEHEADSDSTTTATSKDAGRGSNQDNVKRAVRSIVCVRPKPLLLIAIQWTGINADDVIDLVGASSYEVHDGDCLLLKFESGQRKPILLDFWVFIDERAEVQSYSPESFWDTFEIENLDPDHYAP